MRINDDLETVEIEFQYHTGPIKSPMRNTLDIILSKRFNTTLVQLKVCAAWGYRDELGRFNTTLVQLKGGVL